GEETPFTNAPTVRKSYFRLLQSSKPVSGDGCDVPTALAWTSSDTAVLLQVKFGPSKMVVPLVTSSPPRTLFNIPLAPAVTQALSPLMSACTFALFGGTQFVTPSISPSPSQLDGPKPSPPPMPTHSSRLVSMRLGSWMRE